MAKIVSFNFWILTPKIVDLKLIFRFYEWFSNTCSSIYLKGFNYSSWIINSFLIALMFCLFWWRLEIFGFSGGEWRRHYDGGGCATTPDRIYTAQAAVQVSSALLHRRYSSDAISANDHHFYSPAKKKQKCIQRSHNSRNGNAFLNSQRFSVEKSSESLL